MRRGDVVLVELPPPVGPAGREQTGTRPAVVVQADADDAGLSTVLIVPLTSRLSAMRFRGSFLVQPTKTNGLDVESVVLTHQLRAIDRRRIGRAIGRFADDQMSVLDSEICKLLGLQSRAGGAPLPRPDQPH